MKDVSKRMKNGILTKDDCKKIDKLLNIELNIYKNKLNQEQQMIDKCSKHINRIISILKNN